MILLSGIVTFLTSGNVFPAIISAVTTVIVFFLTLFTKRFIDTKVLSSKLETEHKFDQRKKIKEVLAQNKVHLLTACEDLNRRLWNFANNHEKNWIKSNGDYSKEHYYLHSFVYRIICVYAWIKKIEKDMIFLDTTIATKKDLEFIKFLKIFPQIFCDLTIIEGKGAKGNYAVDHFFRNNFDDFSNCIITDDGVKSYAYFIKHIGTSQKDLKQLFLFLDGITPTENRSRWDRLHFLNLTLLVFLNNYGYDFQQTSEKKIEIILTKPKVSAFLKNYFDFLKRYKLENNKHIIRLEKIAKKYFKQ